MSRVELSGLELNPWNLKEASHESIIFTSSPLEFEGSLARKRRFHESWMRLGRWDLHETLRFFRVNGSSDAEKSWLACATGAGVVALAWKFSRISRAVELMVPGDFFSSLMVLCYYCVLHVLRRFVHWNCCSEEARSLLNSSVLQLNVCRSQRNGCVKVSRCCSCKRNTFCVLQR